LYASHPSQNAKFKPEGECIGYVKLGNEWNHIVFTGYKLYFTMVVNGAQVPVVPENKDNKLGLCRGIVNTPKYPTIKSKNLF
jgi:hypothetical protein